MSFFLYDCVRAKRAKKDSSGTDRRTFLKGMGLVGGAVAAGSLVTVEADDVFFKGEETDELPTDMKIVKGSASGGTISTFVPTGPSKSTFFEVASPKVWDPRRKMYI